MMNSCASAFRRGPSRFEIDPRAFIEHYLDNRRRSRVMRTIEAPETLEGSRRSP